MGARILVLSSVFSLGARILVVLCSMFSMGARILVPCSGFSWVLGYFLCCVGGFH